MGRRRKWLTNLSLGMAIRPELGRLAEQAAAEPGAVALPLVRDDLHLQAAAARAAAAHLAGPDPGIHQLLDVALQRLSLGGAGWERDSPNIVSSNSPAG